jgi:hypothetical protein
MLLLLGAAGGSLRGLVEAYNQTIGWQAARREHRKDPTRDNQDPPDLRDFFDPVPDLVAAAFHTLLGATAAVTFGMSGQISGFYAAIAVGISAPALLAQLGRVQSVGEVVAGNTNALPNAIEASSPRDQQHLTATPARSPGQLQLPETSLPGASQEGTA